MKLSSTKMIMIALGMICFCLFPLIFGSSEVAIIGSEQSVFLLSKEDDNGINVRDDLFAKIENMEKSDKAGIKLVDSGGQIKYDVNTLYHVETSYVMDGALYTCECKLEPDFALRYARYFEKNPEENSFTLRDDEVESFQIIVRKYIPGETGVTMAQSQIFEMNDKYSLNAFYFGVDETKAFAAFYRWNNEGNVDLIFLKLPFNSNESPQTRILSNAFTGTYNLHVKFRDDGIFFFDEMYVNNLQGRGLYKFDFDTQECHKVWDPVVISNFNSLAKFTIDYDKSRIIYFTFADPGKLSKSRYLLNIYSMQEGKKIIEPELFPSDIVPLSITSKNDIIDIRSRNRDTLQYGQKTFRYILAPKRYF